LDQEATTHLYPEQRQPISTQYTMLAISINTTKQQIHTEH